MLRNVTQASDIDGFFGTTDMRFGTWGVKDLCKADSLKTVARVKDHEMNRACSA
jgi:hypothetical protein